MASDSSMFKLSKLEKASDYIQWQRRVKAYVQKDDYSLICLTDQPADTANPDAIEAWEVKNAKAKSTIILTLGDAVMAKTRAIVDNDDRSAKELWEELRRLYTTSNLQVITNLSNRLNSLIFDETKETWDKFL